MGSRKLFDTAGMFGSALSPQRVQDEALVWVLKATPLEMFLGFFLLKGPKMMLFCVAGLENYPSMLYKLGFTLRTVKN